MTTYKELEWQKVLDIAQEYKTKGYEVVVEPDPQALPDFLKEFRLDLIAQRGGDNIVVAVRSYASLGDADELSELVQAVRGESKWRLELAVVNPKRGSRVSSVSADSAMRDRLADISQLQSEGYPHAASLATLSALEAALRLMDTSLGSGRMERPAPVIARALFKRGFLTLAEHAVVARGLDLRKSTIHTHANQTADDQLTEKLLTVIWALLERLPVSDHQPTLAAA